MNDFSNLVHVSHDNCDCRMCRKLAFKEKALRNSESWLESRNREWRKGWKDSYRDTTGAWFDRTVTGMFMIGAIATAVGLI